MSRRGFPFRIFSILRAAWASFWIFMLPKDLWGVLCVWPALFLAGASYLWEPSEQGLRLIVLAAVWDAVMGFWLTLSAMNTTQKALIATITRLRDSSYTPLEWDRILSLGPDASTVINRSSRISYLGRQGLPYNHSKDVRFFRVEMGESGVIPCGLGVFNIPFSETVILVRDDPENATVEERFGMYHEIGHSLGIEFALQSALHKGVKLPLMAVALGVLGMPPGRSSWLTLFCTIAGLLLVRMALQRRGRNFRALYEMKADQFAIDFLNADEKRYVLDNLDDVLPEDQELSPLEQQTRTVAARAFLQTGVDLTESHPALSPWAFILETQLAALNLGAWMIMLAGLIGAPGTEVAEGFKWLVVAVVVLTVLRFVKHYVRGWLLDLVLLGRVRWEDGKFRLRRGRLSPDPVSTA
ncbi:MAG TPA: hypothetical protein VF710_05630 [Longimicrobium sp.]|jgi:hypothetical protein